MTATCSVAALLPKFDAAVQRFNELDEQGTVPGYGGLTRQQLLRQQNAAWRRLRHLEAQAMLELASSEEGRTLQLTLAVAEAFTLRSWAQDDTNAVAAFSRLRGALKSVMAPRDLSILRPDTVDFYLGNLLGRGRMAPAPVSTPASALRH